MGKDLEKQKILNEIKKRDDEIYMAEKESAFLLKKNSEMMEDLAEKKEEVQEDLEEIYAKMETIQKSTRTLIPYFIRWHNYCRSKWQWYYNWHTNPWATLTHWILLMLFVVVAALIFIFSFFNSKIERVVASSEQTWSTVEDWTQWKLDNLQITQDGLKLAIVPIQIVQGNSIKLAQATPEPSMEAVALPVSPTPGASTPDDVSSPSPSPSLLEIEPTSTPQDDNPQIQSTAPPEIMSSQSPAASPILAPVEYKTSGTATIVYNPHETEAVDWLSTKLSQNLNGGTIETKFSTDNILWTDDVKKLANADKIYLKIIIKTSDTSSSPELNTYALKYSRLPFSPSDLKVDLKSTFFSKNQILSAGDFKDLDDDKHTASQWQITDKSGDYSLVLIDSEATTKELTSYKIEKNLDDGDYYFRVRYQDSMGAWSSWSDECSFTVNKADISVLGDEQILKYKNEIVTARTATSKTLDSGYGQKTLEAYAGIIHYKDDYKNSSSVWKDINPSHYIDFPDYVLYDQMPSMVKVYKDKIGYEIQSRETGEKYTVELQDIDGNPKVSTATGGDGLVSWADINGESEKLKAKSSKLAQFINPVLAQESAQSVDNGNLKFEFEIGEYGVRLWKTIDGPDAPKNFTWKITKTGTGDKLKFRDNPDAFEVENGQVQTDQKVEIEARKIEGTKTDFIWQETAPQSDIKIDTDVVYYPDAHTETTTVDGLTTATGSNASWADVHNNAGYLVNDTAASGTIVGIAADPTFNNSWSRIDRSLYLFDTSAVPSAATITTATMSIYGSAKTDTFSPAITPNINIYSSNPTSNTALTGTDYSTLGTTAFSSAITYADWSTSGYNNFILDANGIANISKGGISKFGARNANYDVANSAPTYTAGASATFSGYFADQAGTSNDPKLSITYAYNDSIFGTCKQYNESTNCDDAELIKVAVNGTSQAQTATTLNGSWIIYGVSFATGDVITVWVDGVADTKEAMAVTKYDGSGNITGMLLYEDHLTIGSDDNQTVSNTNLSQYDNSVSGDEDIFFDVTTGALVVDSTNQTVQDTLYILSGNTFQPGGTVTTTNMTIKGTFNPEANTINVAGNWNATSGTVNPSTSSVLFNATATGKTITSASQAFATVTFNGTGGGWTLQDDLTASSVTVTAGTLVDNAKTVTVNGNIVIGSTVGILTSKGTWIQGATGSIENPAYQNSFGSLTIAGSGVTTTMSAFVYVGYNASATGRLTLGPGTLNGASKQLIHYFRANDGLVVNNLVMGTNVGNYTFYPLGIGRTQTAFTLPNGFTSTFQIQIPSGQDFTATGNWDLANNSLRVVQDSSAVPIHFVNMDIYNLNCNNLTIGSGGTSAISGFLKLGSGTHAITGNVVRGNSANVGDQLDFGTSTTSIRGSLTLTGITATMTSASITMNATATGKTITSASQVFGNLTFNGSGGGWTIQDALNVDGDFRLQTGILAVTGQTQTYAGNFQIDNGTTFTKGGAITFDGTAAKTYTDNSTTLQNIGAVTITKTHATPTNNKITLAGSMKVDTMTISTDNTLDLANSGYTLNLSNAGATADILTITGTLTTGTSTINYSATNSGGDINVNNVAYSSLQLSGAETYVLTGNQTGSNAITADITIDNGATLTTGTNYNITLAGSFTNNGTYTNGTATITFNATAIGKTIKSNGNYFQDLTFNGSGGAWTLQDTLDTNGNLTLTAGTLAANSLGITLAGNWLNNGGTFTPGTQTITFDATGTGKTITSNGQVFSSVVFNGSGGGWTLQDNLTIAADFTLTTGTLNASSMTLTVAGNFDSSAGTFTQGTSTVDLTGTGTLNSGNTYFYNLKCAHNTKTTTLTSSLTRVNNIFYTYSGGTYDDNYTYLYKSDGDPFIDTGATLTSNTIVYMSTQSISVSGHNFLGVMYRGSTNDVTYTLTSDVSATSIKTYSNTANKLTTLSTGSANVSTQNLYVGNSTESGAVNLGSGNHTISTTLKRNSGATSTANTLNFNTSAISVAGDIDFTGITVTAGTSNISMTAAATGKTITSASQSFNNLTFNGSSGGWTLQDTMDVNGDLTLTAGTLTDNSQMITLAGNWLNNGGILATGTGTVTFDATATGKTITSASQTFNNVIFNGSGGGWTLQDAMTMNVDFTLTQGSFSAGTYNVTAVNMTASGSTTRALTMGSGTWTVSGNWNSSGTNQTITPGTSTLDLTGTGNLTSRGSTASPYDFYNLKCAHNTKTTTTTSSVTTGNIAYFYSGGTFTNQAGTAIRMFKSDGDPIINTGATFTNAVIIYRPNANISVSGQNFGNSSVTYSSVTNNATITLSSGVTTTGDIIVNSITAGKAATLNVVSNNLSAGNLYLSMVSYGAGSINLGSGTHTFSGNISRTLTSAVTGNAINFGSSTTSVAGSINFTGITVTPGTSTVRMNATTAGKTIRSEAGNFNNLTFDGVGGIWNLQDDINILANLSIVNGTFTASSYNVTTQNFSQSGGTYNASGAGKSTAVYGDFAHSAGTFNPGTGTVAFGNTSTNSVSGDTTFYHFDVMAAGKTLNFTSGSTQTITGTFTANGTVGHNIVLAKSGTGQWKINPQSTISVSYVTVSDSNNLNGVKINPANSTNGGNNTFWFDTAPTNDSVTFTNPYTSNVAIADDSTVWNFRVLASDVDGANDLDYIEIHFANSSDAAQPYDSLKYRWVRSTDTFSEVTDTQSAASIVSTSTDSNSSGNQWTLDFKIKFNSSFATKDTNYAIELYTLDGDPLTPASDTDNYTNQYQVTDLSIALDVDYDTVAFGGVLPGNVVTGTTIATVTSNYNNGYNLAVQDNVAGSDSVLLHTDTSTRIADYAGTITTPTIWSGTGFGICVYQADTSKESKWGTGTTETDLLNKYAGIVQSATTIHTKTNTPTNSDKTYIGYKLVVPNTQKTGNYSGTVVYTATGVLQ